VEQEDSDSEDVEDGQLPNKKLAMKRINKNNMRKKISMSVRLRRNVNGV
jgi:hypothetical protein